MSHTSRLSNKYCSFFEGSLGFAVSPYTKTFNAIAHGNNGNNNNSCAALLICGVLTFAVPVLPTLTFATTTLAMIAMVLAVASMFLTFPLTLLIDVCTSGSENSGCCC